MFDNQFADPQDAPSVKYLSDAENLNDQEKTILPKLWKKDNVLVINALKAYLEQKFDTINHRFVSCVLDQLIKIDRKTVPAIITDFCHLEHFSKEQADTLQLFLNQIHHSLTGQSLPFIGHQIDDLVFQKIDSKEEALGRKLTVDEKNWFFYTTKAHLYFEEGYFYDAFKIGLRLQKKYPDKEMDLFPLLENSWRYVEGLKLGVILKMRRGRLTEKDVAMLDYDAPVLLNPPLIPSTIFSDQKGVPSAKYLGDYQKFPMEERGIIYQLVRGDYNILVYTLRQLFKRRLPADVDLVFVTCIIDQLARRYDITLNSLYAGVCAKEKEAERCRENINKYLEQLHNALLNKQLPKLDPAKVRTKAENLTNKLQQKLKADWSEEERAATLQRGIAYVYSSQGYHEEALDVSIKVQAKYPAYADKSAVMVVVNERFMEARNLGSLMAQNRIKSPKTEAPILSAFKVSKKPIIYNHAPKDIFTQLNISFAEETTATLKLDNGGTTIFITNANQSELAIILNALSPNIIKSINLKSCDISELPSELFSFKNIFQLTITDCAITSISPEIMQLNNLSSLTLSQLPNIKELPKNLGQLSKLSKLRLNLKNLEALSKSLQDCTALTSFTCHNTPIKIFPDWLCQLTELDYLDISNNQMTTLPATIEQLVKLKELIIYRNPWKTLPSSILKLKNLKGFRIQEAEIAGLQVDQDTKTDLIKLLKSFQENRRRRDEFYRNIGK